MSRSTAGALAFGLGNCLAAILFGLGRTLTASSQFSQPDLLTPMEMFLVFGLFPSILAGGLSGYLLGSLLRSSFALRLAIAGACAGGIAALGFSASFLAQLGIRFSADLVRALPTLQAAGLGLLTGLGFGMVLHRLRTALLGGLAGMLGFAGGFLLERMVLIGLSLVSAASGYHFPAAGLQHPWYWVTWILPYSLYGAFGGAVLALSVDLKSRMASLRAVFHPESLS